MAYLGDLRGDVLSSILSWVGTGPGLAEGVPCWISNDKTVSEIGVQCIIIENDLINMNTN